MTKGFKLCAIISEKDERVDTSLGLAEEKRQVWAESVLDDLVFGVV